MATVRIAGADRTANTGGKAADLLVVNQSARLFSITVFNTGPSQYVQLHDSGASVANGSVAKMVIKVLADDDRSIDYINTRLFANGIYVCNSSTPDTKTAGAADCVIDATFRTGV